MQNAASQTLAAMHPSQMIINSYRAVTSSVGLALSVWDQINIAAYGYDRVPPMWLRCRVQGTPDVEAYVNAGQYSRWSIDGALGKLGKWLTDFPNILDFGCGCGRTLRWMSDAAPSVKLYGTDIDAEAVEWCNNNLKYTNCQVNGLEPPLDYPDNHFDLIYALSVFTHLTEKGQFIWLDELTRVLKPNGILLLTFMGYDPEKVARTKSPSAGTSFTFPPKRDIDLWSLLSPANITQLEETGYFFMPYYFGPAGKGYGNAYHRRDYIQKNYTKQLKMREYLPDALAGYLDVALLEKQPPTPAKKKNVDA